MSITPNEATQSLDRTVVTAAAGGNATIIGSTVKCAVCGTENAPTEKYCAECGFLLASSPGAAVDTVETGPQAVLTETVSGREHFLKQGENTVGREGCDVLIADPTVSRRHAVVTWDGASAWVDDCGSTNGTFVDGAQVRQGERVELHDGADLKFGSTGLTVKLPSAAEEQDAVPEATEASAAPEVSDAPEVDVASASIPEPTPAPEPIAPESEPEPMPLAWLESSTDFDARYPIVAGVNTIGRRASNMVTLAGDSYVSGAHAEIEASGGTFILRDIGSTNGTVINGMKLQPRDPVTLAPGDHIVFGQTALEFRL